MTSRQLVKFELANSTAFFLIDREVISRVSTVFASFLGQDTFDGMEPVIGLNCIPKCTFEVFVEWLLTDTLTIHTGYVNDIVDVWGSIRDAKLVRLIEIFAFARSLEIKTLEQATTDMVLDILEDDDSSLFISTAVIDFAYAGCSDSPYLCPLLRLLVDASYRYETSISRKSYQYSTVTDGIIEYEGHCYGDDLPIDFLRGFYLHAHDMRAKLSSGKMNQSYSLNACDHHDHGDSDDYGKHCRNYIIEHAFIQP